MAFSPASTPNLQWNLNSLNRWWRMTIRYVSAWLPCWCVGRRRSYQLECGFPKIWQMVAINLTSCSNSYFISESRVIVCMLLKQQQPGVGFLVAVASWSCFVWLPSLMVFRNNILHKIQLRWKEQALQNISIFPWEYNLGPYKVFPLLSLNFVC